MLFKMLKRRENLGSTGIGRGIAIPHCRSLVVNKLRVAFGRKKEGVDFKAIDEKPVHFFFLIVAPPLEVSNQYLPVLGKIAQFSKEPDVPARLLELTEPKQFLALLEGKGRLDARRVSGDSSHRERQSMQRQRPIEADSTYERRPIADFLEQRRAQRSAVHAAQRAVPVDGTADEHDDTGHDCSNGAECVNFAERARG